MFTLHEKAIENINDSANSLIHSIEKIALPETKTEYGESGIYISDTLTDKEISDVKLSLSNSLGDEICKYFYQGNLAYGFINKGYETFCSIAQKIYKNKSISRILSFNYLKEKLFLWIQDKSISNTSNDFHTYLSGVCESDVKTYTIIIPVIFTLSEKEFSLGEITDRKSVV